MEYQEALAVKWKSKDVSLVVLWVFLLLAAFSFGAFVAFVLTGCCG